MQVEELQWELFRQLLQFVPSSSGELQTASAGCGYFTQVSSALGVQESRGKQEYMAPPGHFR
jgi:hypothetical protein